MINYDDNLVSYRRKKKKKNHKIVLGAIYSPTNNFTLGNKNTLGNKSYFKLNKLNRNKQEKTYLTKKRLNGKPSESIAWTISQRAVDFNGQQNELLQLLKLQPDDMEILEDM